MTVAIVIPTIEGRAQDLARCLEAYGRTAPRANYYIEKNHSSCGEAWIAGAAKAQRDGFEYVHFSADDLEPHEGWLDVAIETVQTGFIPAPLVFNPDGELDSAGLEHFGQYRGPYVDWQLIEGTTVPFLTRAMWEAIGMVPIHYCSDLYISALGRHRGWETAIRTGMRFTHHTSLPGRNYERVAADTRAYVHHLHQLEKGRST